MANDTALNSCPECGTVQTMNTPFCENCGFRLKSQKTLVEGFAAVQPSKVPSAQVPPVKAPSAIPPTKVSGLSGRETSPEHKPVVLDDMVPVGSRTVVGGLAAVPFGAIKEDIPAPVVEPEPSAVSSIIMQRPTEASALMRIPEPHTPRVGASRLVLFTMLWACIAAMAAMLSYFMITTRSQDHTQPIDFSAVSVEIAGGTLLSGLDEETRAFILTVCLRAADDPDSECEQDKLLRGEFPQQSVAVKAFSMDAAEVSTSAYGRCVAQGTCAALDYKSCKVYTPKGLQIALRVPKLLREGAHPAVCVTREQAQAYCTAQGGALPAHEQWEWAARGGEDFLFPWGNTWSPTKANWGEFDVIKTPVAGAIDGFAWTAPAGQFKDGKSPSGLYDMAGNVSEWVQGTGRFGEVRGGSWTSNPFALRTTVKKRVVATDRRTDVGFRCVHPPKQ